MDRLPDAPVAGYNPASVRFVRISHHTEKTADIAFV